MKSIVFDTGPVISLATNSLLWVLGKLKERYPGKFLIPIQVKNELIEKPIATKRYKLEALQVNREINRGTLTVVDDARIDKLKQELMELANNSFSARGVPMRIVQDGEMGALAAAVVYNADAIVIDERTTRELIESPQHLADVMSKNLQTKVNINHKILQELQSKVKHLRVIRSIELAVVAYELGWFDQYLTQDKDARKTLIEAVLWGIKIRGASISQREIDKIVKLEK